MNDNPDLTGLLDAAEAVQEAAGVLVERLERLDAMLSKPKPMLARARDPDRVQITLTVPREILRRLDALAQETGQARARLFVLGAARLLRDGI
jgi:hypothetical protein